MSGGGVGLGAGVAGVVVQVAGQHEPDPVALGVAEHAVDEPQHGVERAVGFGGVGLRARAFGLEPARGRRAEDDFRVAEVETGGAEVGELLGVDRGVELAVDGPQPPARGQLHREVATRLERAPTADVVALVAAGIAMSSSPDRASRCTHDSQKLRRKDASPSYQSWLPGSAITGGRSTTLSRIAAVRSTSLSRCSYCSAEATG